MSRKRMNDDRGIATVILVGIVGMVIAAGAGVAYVATDGFGTDSDTTATSTTTTSTPTSDDTVVGERREDGVVGDPDAGIEDPDVSPMDAAFRDGQSVVCTYTYEAYDASTTLRSKDTYRIDQQTQGGPAHVVRGPQLTYVWIEGMAEAIEFDSDVYAGLAAGQYPMFDPVEFDTPDLFDDGTCQVVAAADESLFKLPADMASAPAG